MLQPTITYMKILAENGMLGQDRNLVSVDFGSLLVILHYSMWIWFHFTRIVATVLSFLPYFKRTYEFLFVSHLLLLIMLFIISSAILFNIGLWHLLLFVISNTPITSVLSVEFLFWSGLNWFGSRLHFLYCPDLRLYQSIVVVNYIIFRHLRFRFSYATMRSETNYTNITNIYIRI